jgi:hypothetical protein
MGFGWRELAVTVSGTLVLASAFLPWWAVDVRVDDAAGLRVETYTGSAWQMSTSWTAAVLTATGATAMWLTWRYTRTRIPRPAWLVLLAAAAISVFLTLDQRDNADRWLETSTRTELTVRLDIRADPDPASSLAADWMHRDELRSYRSAGLNVGVTWGFWTGMTAMVLAGMSMALAGPEGTRPPWQP